MYEIDECPYCHCDLDADMVWFEFEWAEEFEMKCPECGKMIDVKVDFTPFLRCAPVKSVEQIGE